jgi:mRNA-degrading endonuclease HigB of HigAB toxin-antitoxin module
MTRSKLCENGPEIVESKKYTVAHSIPDVTPRNKKKKFDPSGVLYAGSSGNSILKKIYFDFHRIIINFIFIQKSKIKLNMIL